MNLETAAEHASTALAERSSRRSFIGRLGQGVVALAGGALVAAALRPERAEAYHICGHTFTTASCPHPFSPKSRVDRYGYPLHPKHGYPVDDKGRIYKSRKQKRSRMCEDLVRKRYPHAKKAKQGGGWSRCCHGRIRTIYDCCAYTDTRINGDAAVTGYCYRGKKVFCIGYRDLNTRC
ncbi:MAG: hypothetical protein ACRDK3_03335 [Actinomycetota bacterium]